MSFSMGWVDWIQVRKVKILKRVQSSEFEVFDTGIKLVN